MCALFFSDATTAKKKLICCLPMLLRLHIQNYAIIDRLEIIFNSGLNIITGETGAGKSILMGALGLILGERADSSVLQDKDKKCIVEGFFSFHNHTGVIAFLNDNELDALDELEIRREITAGGKSRAFVNDTPVNLNQLKELCRLLVDLHQQFDTQDLGNTGFQQDVLDAMAGNSGPMQEYLGRYRRYQTASAELEEMRERQSRANAELDYHRFLFEELDHMEFRENELEDLDTELKLQSNAENVKAQLDAIGLVLTTNDEPVVAQLRTVGNKLVSIQSFHKDIAILLQRLQATQVELRDIASELESINDHIIFSGERIQQINDRISMGYKLLKKHNVRTTAGLLEIRDELRKKLNDILNLGDLILEKEKAASGLLLQCNTAAAEISARRKKVLGPFSERINGLLDRVGMPNAGFRVHLQPLEKVSDSGTDRTEFLFNANLPPGRSGNGGQEDAHFEPLRKVASGGELSRLMLCIKSLVAKQMQLPTLIFDEIDTGISGEAAKQVGVIMKELSGLHQLISITHQPQIAAKADAHYLVFKAVEKNRIVTSVKLLSSEERIVAIARMLSGEKPTDAAMQNAREMVGN